MAGNGGKQAPDVPKSEAEHDHQSKTNPQILPVHHWTPVKEVLQYAAGICGAALIGISKWIDAPYFVFSVCGGLLFIISAVALYAHKHLSADRTPAITGTWAGAAILVFIGALVWFNHSATTLSSEAEFRISQQPIVTIGKPDGPIAEMVNNQLVLYFHNSGHLPALRFNWGSSYLKQRPFVPLRRSKRKDGSINQSGGDETTIAGGDTRRFEIPIAPGELWLAGGTVLSLPAFLEYCDRFGTHTCEYFELYSGDHFHSFSVTGEISCLALVPIPPPSADEVYLPPCENFDSN
jgi:hypothetical protein